MVTLDSLLPLLSQPPVVLGLDAYGVIYNDEGFFESMPALFEYCNDQRIPIYMVTNNATQSIPDIKAKMDANQLHLPAARIISSGCGCYLMPDVRAMIDSKRVFVYGYPSSFYYAKTAGGLLVDDPADAEVIVFAASQWKNNHHMYKAVFDAFKANPNLPGICINPDHYVRNGAGLMSVMGYYTHQMALQLNRSDWIWMGKPFQRFSELVRLVLNRDGHDPSSLIFCDDNPHNVLQLTHDLSCQGVVIRDTGVANRYPVQNADHLYQMPICKLK